MYIQLVDDKDPFSLQVGVNGLSDVVREVFQGSGGADTGGHDLAGGDIEILDQTLGTVPNILKLDGLDQARSVGRAGDF